MAADVVARDERKFRKDERVVGFVTREDGDAIVVSWVDATPAALYRVRIGVDGVAGELETLETPAALTPGETAEAKARAIAIPLVPPTCTDSYRTVALPSADARWSVYLLPATAKEQSVPIGGSYRIDVADGKVASQHAYTKTCIALDTKPRHGRHDGDQRVRSVADRRPRVLATVVEDADVRQHAARPLGDPGRPRHAARAAQNGPVSDQQSSGRLCTIDCEAASTRSDMQRPCASMASTSHNAPSYSASSIIV